MVLATSPTITTPIIKGSAASDIATLGPELVTAGVTATGTNWNGSYSTGWIHSAGSTDNLTSSGLTLSAGSIYQVTYTDNDSTNSVAYAIGGVTLNTHAQPLAAESRVITATAATGFTIVPTSAFAGNIVLSIKLITPSVATETLQSSDGTVISEARANTAGGNLLVGKYVGHYLTTGTANVGFGSSNSFYSLTTGTYNTAVGYSNQNANTSGISNTSIGASVLTGLTSGSYNTAVGVAVLNYNITGSYNTAIGYGAGPTTYTQLSNTTAIGYDAAPTASNQVMLGNSSVTDFSYYGTIHALSDANLKTNIEEIGYDGGLALDNITPVYYSWISDVNTADNDTSGNYTAPIHAGFTAQNLQPLLPNIVTQTNQFLSIDTTGILAYGVLELQHLRKRVAVLEGVPMLRYSDNGTLDNISIAVVNGGLQLAPTSQTQPACTDSIQGTHWFIAGSATQDSAEEVCAYVSGVIGWRKIMWQ
ncbi:MAG: tail fiber domain-containing protein [Nitrospirae bacterium]|nr:tail fiber domain-containing protein [Nitrospirota bacterium]